MYQQKLSFPVMHSHQHCDYREPNVQQVSPPRAQVEFVSAYTCVNKSGAITGAEVVPNNNRSHAKAILTATSRHISMMPRYSVVVAAFVYDSFRGFFFFFF